MVQSTSPDKGMSLWSVSIMQEPIHSLYSDLWKKMHSSSRHLDIVYMFSECSI